MRSKSINLVAVSPFLKIILRHLFISLRKTEVGITILLHVTTTPVHKKVRSTHMNQTYLLDLLNLLCAGADCESDR